VPSFPAASNCAHPSRAPDNHRPCTRNTKSQVPHCFSSPTATPATQRNVSFRRASSSPRGRLPSSCKLPVSYPLFLSTEPYQAWPCLSSACLLHPLRRKPNRTHPRPLAPPSRRRRHPLLAFAPAVFEQFCAGWPALRPSHATRVSFRLCCRPVSPSHHSPPTCSSLALSRIHI
jgi:hypothetical protein